MPEIRHWHLYTDADGISHFREHHFTDFTFKGVGGADPQWNDEIFAGKASIVITVQPVGWVGEWHENPAPQWIVPLSGAWWVEAMDGTRREFTAGQLHMGADQNCRETGGKRGHRSGTIGDQPCVLMCVKLLEEDPGGDK